MDGLLFFVLPIFNQIFNAVFKSYQKLSNAFTKFETKHYGWDVKVLGELFKRQAYHGTKQARLK